MWRSLRSLLAVGVVAASLVATTAMTPATAVDYRSEAATSAPAVAWVKAPTGGGAPSTEVFYRGQQGEVLYRIWAGNGGWSGWADTLGGQIIGPPGAGGGQYSTSQFKDVLAVRGIDNHVWVREQVDAGSWSPWTNIGGVASSGPAVAVGPGRIDVYVRGTDNALWVRSFTGSWRGWQKIGGNLFAGTGPAATVGGAYVVGTDLKIYETSRTSTGWAPFQANLPGKLTRETPAAAFAYGLQGGYVFATGVDGQVYYDEQCCGSEVDWNSIGGRAIGGPAAAASKYPDQSVGYHDVVVRGTDNALYAQRLGTHTWVRWRQS